LKEKVVTGLARQMDICFTHVCDCPADRKGELKALAFRETKAQATQDHQLIGSRQGLSVHCSGNQDFGVTRGPFHVQRCDVGHVNFHVFDMGIFRGVRETEDAIQRQTAWRGR
jgi:hypothetical protein